MTDYKLVPVEMALPCPFCGSSNIGNKYIETYSTDSSYDTFGCKDCGARFEDGCQDDWNRRAAPAVQGEPVGHATGQFAAVVEGPLTFTVQAYGRLPETGAKLYLAPQPAEQQPSAGDSLTSVPDEVFAAEFAAWWDEHGQFCRAGGGNYERSFAFEAWRYLYPRLVKLQTAAAEQQPAPDVSGLVEALSALRGCIMETRGPDAHSALVLADAALAAHRKQGGRK